MYHFELKFGLRVYEKLYSIDFVYREKKGEICLDPLTKALIPTEKFKKQNENTKTPPKTSITQRLRTDLGWSIGVTTAIQLVWLNRFTGSKNSQCVIIKTHI